MKAKWAEAKRRGVKDLWQKTAAGKRRTTRAQSNARYPNGCWLYILGLDRFEDMWKVGITKDADQRVRNLLLVLPPGRGWEALRVWIAKRPGDVEEALLCGFSVPGEPDGEWAKSSLEQLLAKIMELRPAARPQISVLGQQWLQGVRP